MAAKRPARSSAVSSSSKARPAAGKKAPAKAVPIRRAAAPGTKAKPKSATRAAAKAPVRTVAHAPARTPAKPARKTANAAKSAAAKPVKAKAAPALERIVLDALADMKAVDIRALDVRGITDITDMMVVASGTSDRHVKSIADRVVQRCKEAGFRPFGIEGERDGEWVLVDLHDLVLHVMQPRVREFYALEKLWEGGAARRA